MTSIDEYRDALERAANQEAYLLAHSGLPGPRGNLELARAAAEVCPQPALRRWARLRADEAPTGTAEEFLAFCGVLGLGRALVEDDRRALEELRRHASDPRWRLREAVAMALQRWGEVDFEALAAAMDEWARGSPLERRAAAAALCEPALLTTREGVGEVVSVLTEATTGIVQAGPEERRSESPLDPQHRIALRSLAAREEEEDVPHRDREQQHEPDSCGPRALPDPQARHDRQEQQAIQRPG